MLRDALQFPDYIEAFNDDLACLKKLCEVFVVYCVTKMSDNTCISNNSDNGSDVEDNKSSEWMTIKNWVGINFFIILYIII